MKDYPSEDLPGEYGEFADGIARETGAEAVVVMVLGGNRGNGACPLMKVNGAFTLAELRALVCAALRAMANGIESTPIPNALGQINAPSPKGPAN